MTHNNGRGSNQGSKNKYFKVTGLKVVCCSALILSWVYIKVEGIEQHKILRCILDQGYNQLPGLGESVILIYRFF